MKRRLLLTLTALLLALSSYADGTKIDGIHYMLDSSTKTASVTYTGSSGNYNPSSTAYTGSITIPASITYYRTTYSVTSIGSSAFEGCTGLTSITIPSSVTSIEYDAFFGCTGLTSITIPSSVTSIGVWAFFGCTGLTSITIPSSVRSIGESAFAACTGLTSITIPSSVRSIGEGAFSGCIGLTSITIPSSVTSIGGYAFSGCTGLTSITIPSSVTSIGGYAFNGCTGLTSITIPESVTSIGNGAFSGSTGLTSVTLNSNTIASKTYTSSSSLSSIFGNQVKEYILGDEIQSIGSYAFYGCTGLTGITIPNSVTAIGSSVFRGCSGLTSITIPNSVTSIESSAFRDCTGLTSITIPNSVTSIGNGAFHGCTGLTSITIPNSVTSFGGSAFSGCSGLTSITIPNSVTTIGQSAFSGCTGLTSITIPNSVTSIGGSAFSGCSGLTSITIPNSVTSIGNEAFSGCGLTSVTINSNDVVSKAYTSSSNLSSIFGKQVKEYIIGEAVTSIGDYAFYKCTGLTSITIPSSVTSIGDWAFYDCTRLTSITIPSSVTSIGEMAFSGCRGLTSVTINSNDVVSKAYTSYSNFSNIFGTQVKEYIIGEAVTAIGKYAFYGCSALTSVTINSNDVVSKAYTSSSNLSNIFGTQVKEYIIGEAVTAIGKYAFSYCSGLTSITIPNSVTAIGESAFASCDGLTSVKVDAGNTKYDSRNDCNAIIETATNTLVVGCKNTTIPNSVTTIGSSAFRDCSGLTSITIPNSVTTIGSEAFSGCSGLTSVTIPNSVTTIGYRAFPSSTKLYANKGSQAALALWEQDYSPYQTGTETRLIKPTLSVSKTTQSTATFKMDNYDSSYEYSTDEYSTTSISDPNNIKFTNCEPGGNGSVELYARMKGMGGDWYRISTTSYTTSPISPTAKATGVTPSTATLTPSYIKGDADVTSQKLTVNGETMDVEAGNAYTLTGLKPSTAYPYRYRIVANDYTIDYSGTFTTPALTMETQQPKVISAGNVIVAAETNLDEAVTSVGFEWRRTDWTDDFKSNSGAAYIYAGTMEGYIRNLYTEKLWKYRPYYEASDGTRYYGDWVGLDPTNTSYFEPTVHTYATINVQSNTASVKGYAMRGTDNVAQQGFKYWKVSSSTRGFDEAGSHLMALDIPAYAQTITASGQVMTATLTNLEYASDYCCVAFVTTTEGETFYGELQTFRTGEDVTGIGHVVINVADEANGTPTIVGYYNLQGQRIAEPQKGIVIVRYSDGTSRKMYVR